MRIHRIGKTRVGWIGPVISLLGLNLAMGGGETPSIQPDVIYGRKDGMAMTLDVVLPATRTPGCPGVIFIQSSGWGSDWSWGNAKAVLPLCRPFLDNGMVIFVVRHGSSPHYTIPEIVEDTRRAVRFIRLHAGDWNVNPNRLGVFGASAGGHLALMLATTGDDGDLKSSDPVIRQSSRVAAAVALCPPTDIRAWAKRLPEALQPAAFVLKPALAFDPARVSDYCPCLRVTARTAPTLLIQGDKDELVPLEHGRKMLAALENAKTPSRLVVVRGAGHGWFSSDRTAVSTMADWFKRYLIDQDQRPAASINHSAVR